MRAQTVLLAAFLLAACGSSEPARVAVLGTPEDLAPLTGEWTGTYDGGTTGRSGSITFHLTEDPQGAHGDVVLVPQREFSVTHDQQRHEPFQGAMVLSIEFVRVAANEVNGRISPYPDPEDSTVTLETRFTGHRNGDAIEGTFVTNADRGASPQRGTWRVRRKTVSP